MKLFTELAEYSPVTRFYWGAIIFTGVVALSFNFPHLIFMGANMWLHLILLAAIVFLTGLFPVRIPGTNCVITPSDIFIFLSCLLLGAPAATLVAGIDSFVASSRASGKWSTRLASSAINALSMFSSAHLFQWLLNVLAQTSFSSKTTFFVSLLIFATTYFFLTSLLMATYSALKQNKSLWQFWWSNYAWISTTYLSSASVAGIIYLGLEHYGIVALLAAFPIMAVVFTTTHFYFRQADEHEKAQHQRVEAAEAQAVLAKKHLQEMQESEERFRNAFDLAAIGMALVSPVGKWLQVNDSLGQILGYSETELLATDFQTLTHPDDLDSVRRGIAQLLIGHISTSQIEHRFLHQLGHIVWVSLSASLIGETETQARRLIFQIQDITDRRRAESRLFHDAFHDALTGLPNRALFLDHLELAMARTQRHPERCFAVLFLDFDRFKIVNDSLGHLAGDELLIEVARRLRNGIRPDDTIARLGGDEFTILLEEIQGAEEAIALAERIKQMLLEPVKLTATEVTITASIGIAFNSTGEQKPEEVLRDADTAMYQAKSHGKARHALFDQSMHERALTQLKLENDLRRAIERQEFFLVYQPIVSLEDGHLQGFEALVRWQHPERGFINPGDFIAVAEETGLIIPLGRWVMEQAITQMQQWKELSGDRPLTMSINLSGKQLAQDEIVECVTSALNKTGLSAQHLKLEITESILMENIEIVVRKLNQLRELGIKLSIDDFGTGYSSLSYLHRLPINTLKVDRSFVLRMADNNENAEIVRTIVTLANTLKMDVIAEGIETKDQLRQLQKLGVEGGQGYLFARPMNAEAATIIVTQMQTWQAFLPMSEQVFQAPALTATYTM